MPHAQLDGVRLYYTSQGEGPPLLCIMGLGAPLEGFALQIRHFAREGRRVVAFDNRGVGRSSIPWPPYSTEVMAEEAVTLLDRLELDQVDLMGSSMGGMIAQHIAARHPARVRSLVLAATFGHADVQLRRRVANMTAASLAAYVRGNGLSGRARLEKALRDAWEGRVVTLESLGDEGKALLDQAWALRQPGARADLGVVGQLWAVLTHDARSLLPKIRCPTLVIAGSSDQLSSLNHARTIARAIPGARLEILAGAPHGMNLASAPVFNLTVDHFLSQHSPARRSVVEAAATVRRAS